MANTSGSSIPTYAFAAYTAPWTIPAAEVSIYDEEGAQNIRFDGEEVVASPAALRAWSEMNDAVREVDVPAYMDPQFGVSSLGNTPSTSSFEIIGSSTSHTSSYDMGDSSTDTSCPSDDDGDLPDGDTSNGAYIANDSLGCLFCGRPRGSVSRSIGRANTCSSYNSQRNSCFPVCISIVFPCQITFISVLVDAPFSLSLTLSALMVFDVNLCEQLIG
ncbi:hypothetical protein B0H13DRAFT_2307877 [Mycena leptocephala]|nr:hypothetical protein B0H13DRAFT_2307877 [Mycena leptocephala]